VRGGGLSVRLIFALYVGVIVAGIALYFVVGVLKL
jgi:hypothetical protein